MKRLVVKRKLKRCCTHCGKKFSKGDVYYKKREVFVEEGLVMGFEFLACPKCKYKQERRKERCSRFKTNCPHPDKFIDEKWRYMTGEAVVEPDYSYCTLCGKIL